MTIRELYPYWPETHDEIVDLLELADEDAWLAKPCHETAGSIRQIVVGLIRHERFWIEQVAQNRRPDALLTSDLIRTELLAELKAARNATARWLAPLTREGLRAVRTAPADPRENLVERNVTLDHIVWTLLEYELAAWGQIKLRLAE